MCNCKTNVSSANGDQPKCEKCEAKTDQEMETVAIALHEMPSAPNAEDEDFEDTAYRTWMYLKAKGKAINTSTIPELGADMLEAIQMSTSEVEELFNEDKPVLSNLLSKKNLIYVLAAGFALYFLFKAKARLLQIAFIAGIGYVAYLAFFSTKKEDAPETIETEAITVE